MKNILFLFTSALIATIALVSCQNNKTDNLIHEERTYASVADQVTGQYNSIDSIGSKVIIVHPQASASNNDENKMYYILRIIAIITPFAFVIAIVWLILYYKRVNLISKYDVVESAIRNGITLPDSFYVGKYANINHQNLRRLYNALLYITIGTSAILLAISTHERDLAAILTLPLFIGFAKLITYFIAKKQQDTHYNTFAPKE